MALSDALSEGIDDIDHYLLDPDWYEGSTRTRALAIRAAMDALRGYLDTYPSAAAAIDAAIAGDTQALEAKITDMAAEWRGQEQPNLHFSPTTFRAWALAAVKVLQALDTHIVPLLPDLEPLAPKPRED